jgi:hypothetical protein
MVSEHLGDFRTSFLLTFRYASGGLQQILARPEIVLGADPDRADAVLPVRAQLRRAGADPPVPRDDDGLTLGGDWHPVQIGRADRHVLVARA